MRHSAKQRLRASLRLSLFKTALIHSSDSRPFPGETHVVPLCPAIHSPSRRNPSLTEVMRVRPSLCVCLFRGAASSGNASFRQPEIPGVYGYFRRHAAFYLRVCVCLRRDHRTLLGSAIRSMTFAGVQGTLSEEQTTSNLAGCHHDGPQSQFD